jgi:sialic acid synthase SpsE
MQRTFVIAEAGSNHGGDLPTAQRLINCAHACGADAVKFQWTSNPERMAERRHTDAKNFERLCWPAWWFTHLTEWCRDRIEFMCSVYLPEDIATIAPYVKRFKVASFEAGDVAFLEAHIGYDKDILVSCGMGQEPDDCIFWKLLHCTSAYPCPDAEVGLNRLLTSYGGSRWGLSDHSKNPLTGAVAVGAGATIIETHFRLNDTPATCPDFAVSRTPDELYAYIRNIRQAEVLMGDPVKRIQPSEEPNLRYRVSS